LAERILNSVLTGYWPVVKTRHGRRQFQGGARVPSLLVACLQGMNRRQPVISGIVRVTDADAVVPS